MIESTKDRSTAVETAAKHGERNANERSERNAKRERNERKTSEKAEAAGDAYL